MDVDEVVEKRRAYRKLDSVQISDELIRELAKAARLAPSCYNKQPWKFVFARSSDILSRLKSAYSPGNEWAYAGSSVVAVFASKESDCVITEREYYLFDTGIAVGQMLLRATELGFVAHPIAGYSPLVVREVLGIPEKFNVITLIVIGKKTPVIKGEIDEEAERPTRFDCNAVYSIDRYDGRLDTE